MASYLSLEEAAAKLGIPTDRLVELRSQGQVRGFRDGTSWKFPDSEIERLADELGELAGGSDVSLVASGGNGSDVELVPGAPSAGSDAGSGLGSGKNLVEIDSAELQLDEPAITHDSAQLDLSNEAQSGSTGPITDEELKEIAGSDGGPSPAASEAAADDDSGEYRLQDETPPPSAAGKPPTPQAADPNALSHDSDDDLQLDLGEASSLELMGDLESPQGGSGVGSDLAGDVLSDLDLLGAEQEGSGLISGDSENVLESAGSGSGVGSGSGLEDALDDDDLVIADDDDDLVLGGVGSDIALAGDSGINLMSPSDSGLSLEGEPLDLAGSSVSALDLGAEAGAGSSGTGGSGSGPGKSGSGSGGDEEFQLSPSGIGIEADDSGSQVIEIEDSEAIAEPVDFAEGGLEAEEGFEAEEPVGLDEDDVLAGGAMGSGGRAAAYSAYEVPFSLLQVVSLAMIICVLGLGGMLMTDLVRNMWAYSEPAAPVSSLTNMLIDLMGWGK